MSQEQRLILAFALTVGILGLWSLLPPPIAPPPAVDQKGLPPKAAPASPVTAGGGVVAKPAHPEPILQAALDGFAVGLGEKSGSLQRLSVDGADLLGEAEAGFLEIQLPSAGEPLAWQTEVAAAAISGRAEVPGQGLQVVRRISKWEGGSPYLLRVEVEVRNPGAEERQADLRCLIYRPLEIAQPEDRQYLSGMAGVDGKAVNLHLRPGGHRTLPQAPEWITSQRRSHALVVQPIESESGDTNKFVSPVSPVFHVEQSGSGQAFGWLHLKRGIAPGQRAVWLFRIYAGPMELRKLREAEVEEAVSFGAFSGIARILLKFLGWSYGRLHSYGWAICLLSLAVWLPFAPLTWYSMRMSTKTMEKMAVIKPQEERLRREHRNNPQRMQQELLALYRKHGVNPASGCLGCLPMLATMPVYIALFQVLNRAPELSGAPFLWIEDLSRPDRLIRFPTAIPLLGEALNILPVITTVAMVFQQRLMQPAMPQLTDEQRVQQQIFKIFPLMLLVFFYNLPSGFMIYWAVNSALMAGQQLLIARRRKR